MCEHDIFNEYNEDDKYADIKEIKDYLTLNDNDNLCLLTLKIPERDESISSERYIATFFYTISLFSDEIKESNSSTTFDNICMGYKKCYEHYPCHFLFHAIINTKDISHDYIRQTIKSCFIGGNRVDFDKYNRVDPKYPHPWKNRLYIEPVENLHSCLNDIDFGATWIYEKGNNMGGFEYKKTAPVKESDDFDFEDIF